MANQAVNQAMDLMVDSQQARDMDKETALAPMEDKHIVATVNKEHLKIVTANLM